MDDKYESIRELDDVAVGWTELPEIPPPSLGWTRLSEEGEEVWVEPYCQTKFASRSNRIRVKNIRTGVLIEFDKMVNAARFVGTTSSNMRCRIGYETSLVFRQGEEEEEYVFEYDGKERPLEDGSRCSSLDGSVVAVSGKGEGIPFPSYLSIAKHLGLLVGHIIEERKKKLAKKYILGEETFTIEFKGQERRQKDRGRGIVCHWKGIYDGNFEGISGIKVTYGNPQMRD